MESFHVFFLVFIADSWFKQVSENGFVAEIFSQKRPKLLHIEEIFIVSHVYAGFSSNPFHYLEIIEVVSLEMWGEVIQERPSKGWEEIFGRIGWLSLLWLFDSFFIGPRLGLVPLLEFLGHRIIVIRIIILRSFNLR